MLIEEDKIVGKQSYSVVAEISNITDSTISEDKEFFYNGIEYIGILNIIDLDIELPISATNTDEALKLAPCVYSGSIGDSLVIAGHNYKSHFGYINSLDIGSIVYIQDLQDNLYKYSLYDKSVVNQYDVDSVNDKESDLTLFTCTLDGFNRIVLKYKYIEQ